MPPIQGSNHISLTVRDVDRSAAWYIQVFGAVVIADETSTPPASDEPVRYRGLFHRDTMTNLVGLVERGNGSDVRFDEGRIGLDHVAFHLASRDDLAPWVKHLDALGIPHSGIKRVSYADSITFRDPDNIQLEVFWPNLDFWVKRLTSVAG